MRDYSREFRMAAVRRVLGGEKVAAVSQELGIHRKLLYEWLRRVNEGGEASLRMRGRPRKTGLSEGGTMVVPQLAELERALAHQQTIIRFFRHALQQVEELRQKRDVSGATASTESSRQ